MPFDVIRDLLNS